MPVEKRIGRPSLAQYMLELSSEVPQTLKSKELWDVGSLMMLPQSEAARYAQIRAADGGYEREVGHDRWWYWVRKRIDFLLDDAAIPKTTGRLVSFEYWLSPDRNLTLDIVGQSDAMRIELPKPATGQGQFETAVPASFGPIKHITLTGEGAATRLSQQDPRIVRFLVANLTVQILDASETK